MIRHFFLDKSNSIIYKSEQNLGLNPILYVGYGSNIMRSLIHFDIEPIKKLIEDKTFANLDKLKFTLKLTNCFSVDSFPYEKNLFNNMGEIVKRASSFDLILYKLPRHFDAGRGYDYISDFWLSDNKSFSNEGSNWYCCKNNILWDGTIKPKTYKDVTGDIFQENFITDEYEKFINNEDSIIVGTQHFDFGNENLSIDITKYVFDVLNTKHDSNYGLCLAFAPQFSFDKEDIVHYVGFFNDHTNTFFHPYVEVEYNEFISDNRDSFTLGCNNKLYLYCSFDDEPVNLDHIPSCKINDVEIPTKQATKGVYYAEIKPSILDLNKNTIAYDTWSEIALNGVKNEDIEMEFVVNSSSKKISFGSSSETKKNIVPSLYGINDDEKINIGDIREITVDFLEKFSMDKKVLIDSAYYRIYVKDGNREIDIIKYHPIEKGYLNNFFIIYTEDFIPNTYYIDIKVNIGREVKYYKESLRFKLVDNVTERYQ